MKTKNLVVLAVVATVLGIAAYLVGNGSRPAAAKLNGKSIFPGLSVADVTRVEIGTNLVLASSADGWKIESLYGYPADRDKIAENLLKLAELKVGQVVRGRKLGAETSVALKDAFGKELASLKLGDKHSKKASGQAAMYGGGYPDGRYVAFEGETVLVKDALDAFDGDAKKWCNTRIASISSSDVTAVKFTHAGETVELEKGTNSTWTLKGLGPKEELDTSKTYSLDSALSYLDFNSVADPKLTEAELGFSTGFVYTVTVKNGESNTVTRTAMIGNRVKDGSDRYFKLDDGKWVFAISSYSAESMMKTRKDLVKEKKEEKKEEPAKEAPKKEAPAKKS